MDLNCPTKVQNKFLIFFPNTPLRDHCGLPKAFRAWFECRTRFETYTAPPLRGSGLPNQPRDNVTPIHTLWDNCRMRFEDTRFECGLRLPKALRAWFECRTRFEDTQFECGLRLPKALRA